MTEEQIELGRRAVACKGWRWMPGMLARDARWVLHRIQDDGSALDLSDDILERAWGYSTKTLRPIFDDPATLGCLLALVREAWGGDFEQMWLEWYPPLSRWGIQGAHAGARSILLASGPTEAEALVAALEAAP
jgi:hypothetical protein